MTRVYQVISALGSGLALDGLSEDIVSDRSMSSFKSLIKTLRLARISYLTEGWSDV